MPSLPTLPSLPALAGKGRIAVVAAPLATLAVVGSGIALSGAVRPAGGVADLGAARTAARTSAHTAAAAKVSTALTDAVTSTAVNGGTRSASISRDLDRLATTVTDHDWATADLNVYTAPNDAASKLAGITSGAKVAVTGTTQSGFTQIVSAGRPAWVHSDYLADTKPVDPATQGLDLKPCAASASVERGLVPNAVKAWEAVCNAFPQVKVFYGLGNRPEHDTGHAVDAMVYGDSTLGYQIAQFVQAHAAEFDLYDLIYRQHIWTPVRASEGWRLMPDRGSPTANHMDHVHIGVN